MMRAIKATIRSKWLPTPARLLSPLQQSSAQVNIQPDGLKKAEYSWQQDDIRCPSLNQDNQSICCFIQLETDSIGMMWNKSHSWASVIN